MVQYYKISAKLLIEYIRLIKERLAHVGVAVSLKHLLETKYWVRDDVDYPEAVETVEILAFEKIEVLDAKRQTGYRWLTNNCMKRLIKLCYARETKKLIDVLTVIINVAPFPQDEPEFDNKAWQLAQR